MIVPVVFACDDHYVMPLCVAVTSMNYNKMPETIYDIYVMHSGLSKCSIRKLREMESDVCHINLMNVDNMTREIQTIYERKAIGKAVSKETMYRFLLPGLFPNIKKILYLDCDVIIQDDLWNLYSSDIGEAYAGVVTDIDVSIRINALGREMEQYFNAGMLLLNLEKMREDSVEKILEAELFGETVYGLMDQDILNIVLGGNVIYFSEKYNFLSEVIVNGGIERIWKNYEMRLNSLEDYLEKIVILHYACGGEKKPWLCKMPYVSDIFMKYYGMSNFRDNGLTLMPYDMDLPAGKFIMPDIDIPEGSRVILYGAGSMGKVYFQRILSERKWQLAGWVDNKAESYWLQGLPVELPEEGFAREYDYVLLGVMKEETAKTIRNMLVRTGIDEKKIKWELALRMLPFQQCLQEYKNER